MEHSAVIQHDAGKAVDDMALSAKPAEPASGEKVDGEHGGNNPRKRKHDFPSTRQQYGSRGRGGSRSRGGRDGHDDKRHKTGDLGRGEY
ncbi:tRNA pseudouridine synthase 1, partial [Teratosphaeriaceae sp. CCFEE 6253]